LNQVVNIHKYLLKNGGLLLITIPNLRGLNYILSKIFNKKMRSKHNLNIMDKKKFSRLFEESGFEKLHCNYYGLFNFGLFGIRRDSSFRHILVICYGLQVLLNIIFHFIFKNKKIDSKIYCPYLLFLGIKK